MTRVLNTPDGSLTRRLLQQITDEATAGQPKPVESQFAALMPVRKVG